MSSLTDRHVSEVVVSEWRFSLFPQQQPGATMCPVLLLLMTAIATGKSPPLLHSP